MDFAMIAGGVFIVAMTYWDYYHSDTANLCIFDWWLDVDINRYSWPLIFWFILITEGMIGLGLICAGVLSVFS